jgi:hypothetical protein
MDRASAPNMKPGWIVSIYLSAAGDSTLSDERTRQDPRGPEKAVLLHDSEHALEYFGCCLCAAHSIIPCNFDKLNKNGWSGNFLLRT